MNRNDRLMAILMALQQGSETAASLAEKLEVSRRTILRDMNALSEMGVPLYAVSGPQGGYRLMEGYRMPPLQMTSQEAMAILFALQLLVKYPDTPFAAARWTAMDKLKNALPEQMLEQVLPVLEHLHIDVPIRVYSLPLLNTLLEAAVRQQWVSVFYQSMNHRRRLALLPKRIYAAHGFWYCEAYSSIHREVRSFRVDRMSDFREEEGVEAAPAVEELSGSAVHSDSKAGKNSSAAQSTNIKAKLTYRGMLQVERDEHIGECVNEVEPDVWLVDFDCPESEWQWAVELFYRLGRDAVVLAPEKLRQQIAKRAAEVARQYRH